MSLWEKFNNPVGHLEKSKCRKVKAASDGNRLGSKIDGRKTFLVGVQPQPGKFANDTSMLHRHRRLGKELARAKAFRGFEDDYFQDRSNVVFRRDEDWTGGQGYATCAFLDRHERILAADNMGKIDIVRLPAYGTPNEPRALGTQLASSLHVSTKCSNDAVVKMKALSAGTTFVVGLPDGSSQIFSTERCERFCVNGGRPTLFTQKSPSSFVSSCSHVERARRRYFRHHKNWQLSLHRTACSPQSIQVTLWQGLTEILGWDVDECSQSRQVDVGSIPFGKFLQDDARWDFHETQSALLSAHVDAEQDCFVLSLLDSRTPTPVVCVDVTSQDRAPTTYEYITACAWASECCVATAHALHGTETRPNATSTFSSIKVWDVRMLSNRGADPINEISLPQFPNCKSWPLTPASSLQPFPAHSSGYDSVESSGIITRLHASEGGSGALLATVRDLEDQKVVGHSVVYLGGMNVGREISQVVNDPEDNPVYGVASTQSHMICYDGGDQPNISVYDLQDGRKSSKSKKRKANCSPPTKPTNFGPRYSFKPTLKDRYGLQTQLSCLAMNYDGTSAVGGSHDGDLFVWRAP